MESTFSYFLKIIKVKMSFMIKSSLFAVLALKSFSNTNFPSLEYVAPLKNIAVIQSIK